MIESHLREPHTIRTNVRTYSLSGGLSVGTVLFPPIFGHVKVDMAVKYIAVIQNNHLYCSFGISWQVQEFWCANHTKIPYFDREIKYLDFVSGNLASRGTE